MNKLGTTFFLDDSDCRGFTSFCNSSFKMIVNPKLFGELFGVGPILFVRRMNSDFLPSFRNKKASVSIHTPKPPISVEMFGNEIQNFCCSGGRFGNVIHTAQEFCKRAVVGRKTCALSAFERLLGINTPLSFLLKQWNYVGCIVRNKTGTYLTRCPTKRNMPICPNEPEKIGIDFIHLVRYNKGRWINIPFIKRFIQFALHNVGAMLVCKTKTHCLGVCYNGMARAIKFSRTISSAKSMVVLTNEIKFGVS